MAPHFVHYIIYLFSNNDIWSEGRLQLLLETINAFMFDFFYSFSSTDTLVSQLKELVDNELRCDCFIETGATSYSKENWLHIVSSADMDSISFESDELLKLNIYLP